MKDESPVDAVHRVMEREFKIKPDNAQTMMLIDAVRDTTPPPRHMTIAMLRALLREMDPHIALEAWIYESTRKIVRTISKHPVVQQAAKLIDDERMWDELESITGALLWRVTKGLDLEAPVSTEAPIGHKVVLEVTRSVNDKHERQPDRYRIINDVEGALEVGSFQEALQAFINRLG